jgi:hypothetical protein
MKVLVIYKLNSEQARKVIEFEREYENRTGRQLNHFDTETKEGSELAELYDIVDYPAIIATTSTGELLQLWQGENLPLINEVMYYDHSE